MARDVAGLVAGMALLEPGFSVAEADVDDLRVARLPIEADPAITAAIDRALRLSGWECATLPVPGWDEATVQAGLLLVVEAWHSDAALVAEDPDGIGADVRGRLELGSAFDDTDGATPPGWPSVIGRRRSSGSSPRSTSWSRRP